MATDHMLSTLVTDNRLYITEFLYAFAKLHIQILQAEGQH